MQENPMPGDQPGDEWIPPDREDAAWQSKVILLLLDQQPDQLSELEIARELLASEPTFSERDALARAIEDLVRVGILQRCEALVFLTRAVRHLASLDLS